jgi:hypothetical protein
MLILGISNLVVGRALTTFCQGLIGDEDDDDGMH